MIIYSSASSALEGVQNLSRWLSLYLRTHTLAYIIMSLHKHWLAHIKKNRYTNTQKWAPSPPQTPYSFIFFQKPHFLFICNVQNKPTHWAGSSRPANQNLNRTFVITIALYLSISLCTFKTIPFCPCLYFYNHFRSNAQKFSIINQKWGNIKKSGGGGARRGTDEG